MMQSVSPQGKAKKNHISLCWFSIEKQKSLVLTKVKSNLCAIGFLWWLAKVFMVLAKLVFSNLKWKWGCRLAL